MRPLKTNEAFGMGNLTVGNTTNSLVPAVQVLWNTWEIHFLILVSLSLQAFLFVSADMRRRSTSCVLRTVLWLAYLAADFVAIFVLGHLAVHAGQPRHQLMSFWAPFVLVHLGGQDTITAFSKEDNELWKRHLLGLVTQVSIAGYVVAKASWPDARLRAAVVLIFVSGCLRYFERTYCLYSSSPAKLRLQGLKRWSVYYGREVNLVTTSSGGSLDSVWSLTLDKMSRGVSSGLVLFSWVNNIISDLLSGDVPNNWVSIDQDNDEYGNRQLVVHSVGEGRVQSTLQQFLANPGRCNAYDHVGALLLHVYQTLYSKIPFRMFFFTYPHVELYAIFGDIGSAYMNLLSRGCCIISLLYILFQFASAPIALVLFWAAEKANQEDQLLHTSPSDITVSYILLVGAIVLDVSATISTFPGYFQVPAAWYSKKQWSEKLGQYSIINRHVGLPEVTHTPMSKDGDEGSKPSPTKEFILDNLLGFGTRKQCSIVASSRGQWAIQEWMDKHRIPDSERRRKALVKTTIDGITNFPTSVLIWHIATEILYYYNDNDDDDDDSSVDNNNAASNTSRPDDRRLINKHKQISRELSNYIMYLIFKCRVMLTINSQFVHDGAHHGIKTTFAAAEKKTKINDFVKKLFDATKSQQEQQDRHSTVQIPQQEHQHPNSSVAAAAAAAAGNAAQKLLQSAHSVLPRASELAQELIRISNEKERWDLIASVWAEMVNYTAPRCGAAFHYEHLSTGGEFITHLLVLMYIIGPFLPDPDA